MRTKLLAVAVVFAAVGVGRADDGLTKGTPELKSVTALAFGPKGLLFVGDSLGSAVYAIDTGDTKSAGEKPINIERIDGKVGAALGVTEKEVRITDLKVNPASGNAYLAVTRVPASGGTGAGQPAIVKVSRDGTVEPLTLSDVMFSKVSLTNAKASSDAKQSNAKGPNGQQNQSITSMAFVNNRLFVAGLSNEEFSSTLWAIPFPFNESGKGSGIRIYHGAHGRYETNSPIRTFTPYKIGNQESIVASYTCTPLVKIPVSDLKPGAKVQGTTIAELGNMNQPLAMIAYTKDGKDYLLSANSRHGLIKIPTADFANAEAITTQISGTAGPKYEKITEFNTDVTKLDKFDDARAILLVKAGGGLELKTIALP